MIFFIDLKQFLPSLPLSLLLGVAAAALAWQVNKLAGRLLGGRWVYLAPLVEETSKTTAAILFGGDILLTHLAFGAVEGFWEYFSRSNGYAGFAAVASHTFFGFITVSGYRFFGTLTPALVGGCLSHITWNYLVMKYLNKRHKLK